MALKNGDTGPHHSVQCG